MKEIIDKIQKDHYNVELVRKGIHLCSLSIPIVYYFIPRDIAIAVVLPVASILLILDLLRFYSITIASIWDKFFGFLLRKHETGKKKTLTGGTYVGISAVICILFFPKILVVTSFSILIISDISAALIGKKFGKIKIYDKSLEGSLAFFITAIIVVMIAPKIQYLQTEYTIGIIGAAVGTFAELFSFNILDDNLAIPISIGLVMWGLYLLWLPELNIYALDMIR